MQTLENNNYSGKEELLHTEILKNYNFNIVNMSVRYCRPSSKCVDFGAGIGTLATIFKQEFSIDMNCVEIDPQNKTILSKRGFRSVQTLHDIDIKPDFIFSSNVLEHIEDDLSTLKTMYSVLGDNGLIYLYLPAHMLLWTNMDASVGHYRRYEKKQLFTKLGEAGFKIKKFHYADCIGFFVTLLIKWRETGTSESRISPSAMKFYDRIVFPVSNLIDRLGAKYIIGKNIVIVAEKR